MIIELCGLPGSGKSTLEENLKHLLSTKGIRIFSRVEIERIIIAFFGPFRVVGTGLKFKFGKLWLYSSITLKTFKALGPALSLEALLKPVKFRTCYWLLRDRELYRFLLALPELYLGNGSLYFCSEGLAHHALGVMVWGGAKFKNFALKELRALSSEKIRVLYLNLPLEQALQRAAARLLPESWPVSAKNKIAYQAIISKYERELDQLSAVLINLGQPLIKLNALDSPEALVNNAYRELLLGEKADQR